MKNMQHFLTGLACAALVFGFSSTTFARGYGPADRPDGGGAGGCISAPCTMPGNHPGLTEEKRAALDTLMREHRAAVEPLREQLEARHLELNALSVNPNARPEDISKLAKDTAALHARIRSMNLDFREKAQKELGVPLGPRAGMRDGHRMRGYRHMHGCGW